MKEKKQILFLIIVGFLFITAQILGYNLVPGDGIWNFGAIYKLSQGKKMYTDIGIITTDLFFTIGKLLFTLFGSNFFVFQIYNYIIVMSLILLSYKILSILNIKPLFKILTIIIILSFPIFYIPSYNILVIVLMEIGIIFDLKNSNKSNLIHGLLAVIILLTNQKGGVGYIFAFVMVKILINKLNKKTIKEIISSLFIFLLGMIVTSIYYYINGNLKDLINIGFLGMIDFGSNNLNAEIICLYYTPVFLLMITTSIVLLKKIKDNTVKNNIIILLLYGIGSLILIYPIFNYFHILIGLLIFVILCMYNVTYIFSDILDEKAIIKVIKIIIFVVIAYESALLISRATKINKQNLNYNNPYYGAYFDNDIIENKKNVCTFIKNNDKKVIVLSDYALLYGIELNQFNGYFDMPLNGNLGYKGEINLLNKVKKLKDTIILLPDKEKSEYENFQYVNNIRNYIKENYTKTGEIENFDIYYINNY